MFNFLAGIFARAQIINNFEDVTVIGPKGKETLRAKIDTGADLSSIDTETANQLGLLEPANVVERRSFKSGLGRQHRDMVKLQMIMRGRKMDTIVSVTDRSHMAFKMIVGRHNLQGFIVRPDRSVYGQKS